LIALIVTPEGLPLAYEVLPREHGRLHDPAERPAQYRSPIRQRGAHLVMDRGIPTDDVLAECARPIHLSPLVRTPKGRLSKVAKALLGVPWRAVREGVDGKLLRRSTSYLDLQITEASGGAPED
jgi:hypothetical protein